MNNTDCIDYALGELHGERRDAFERELASSTALQQELQETIALLGTLQQVSQSSEGLEDAQRERLLAACRRNITARKQRSTIIRFVIPLSLAALAAIALILGALIPSINQPQGEVAALPTDETPTPPDAISNDSLANAAQHLAIESPTVTAWPTGATSSPSDEPNEAEIVHTGSAPEIRATEGECNFIALGGSTDTPHLARRTPKHTRATEDNPFIPTSKTPETFMPVSMTTDSYAAVRKSILSGQLPDPATIRTDELINAFAYSFDRATTRGPFAIDIEAGKAPWNPERLLIKVGIEVRNPSEHSSILLSSLMTSLKFDPKLIAGYRLIGYEKNGNPANNVKSLSKPSTPLTLTAIYEVEPSAGLRTASPNTPLLSLVIHHKFPNNTECLHASVQYPVGSIPPEGKNSTDFRFASAVAAFGMKLNHATDADTMPWATIEQLAANSLGPDTNRQRADFVDLVQRASRLSVS